MLTLSPLLPFYPSYPSYPSFPSFPCYPSCCSFPCCCYPSPTIATGTPGIRSFSVDDNEITDPPTDGGEFKARSISLSVLWSARHPWFTLFLSLMHLWWVYAQLLVLSLCIVGLYKSTCAIRVLVTGPLVGGDCGCAGG